jgi:acetate kinase
MQTQTTIAPAAAFDTRFHQMWPWAAVIFALGINVAWVALLGYELVSFIKFTF